MPDEGTVRTYFPAQVWNIAGSRHDMVAMIHGLSNDDCSGQVILATVLQ